ncbi:tRNA(fMet)-specific endonuclease VapC [Trinickia symbiotica]|uniref:Ribonuclease VapC n=1 Tax=Trinickia symbiotica TaxID=863227 RepID=A0A2N7X7C9_9BURK|nr:type II toxin-antitoxin system VapC family toxin [Trinickia symbiotica]PMS37534.1 PIN domain-containing protein [Trinickia symbiotica]PPK44059.1 tRNA(fMet)-specific endonuclease VapC [Trinickia symbiotica]
MTLYLLDTNIVSDAIRNTRGSCAARIREMPPERLCTSIVVAAELRFGAEKKGSPALSDRVDTFLASLTVMALNGEADRYYGHLRADLERRGKLIGANDMLIAAHALAIDAVLVTDNTDEFARVPNLPLENWVR